MSSSSEKAAVDYAAVLAQSAGVSQGWLFVSDSGDGTQSVMIKRSVRDIDSNTMRSFIHEHSFDGGSWRSSAFPFELNGVAAYSPSPSGRKLAVVREATAEQGSSGGGSGKGTTSYVIEIWQRGEASSGERGLVERIPTGALHDKIMAGGWFGSFNWDSSETRIVYVAQRSAPKTRSYFSASPPAPAAAAVAAERRRALDDVDAATAFPALTAIPPDSSSGGSGHVAADVAIAGSQFLHREDWGEKYEGIVSLGLYIADLNVGRVIEVPDTSEGLTPGQAQWIGSDKLVYTAWSCEPRKLGMIYCYQRPCKLYSVTVGSLLANKSAESCSADAGSSSGYGNGNGNDSSNSSSEDAAAEAKIVHRCLTPAGSLAQSPRVSHCGTRLAWLSRAEGFDTHSGAFRLLQGSLTADGELKGESTLVDIVDKPDTPDSFPGLWLTELPLKCWSKDGTSLFLTSMWGSTQAVTRINTVTGAVTRLHPEKAAAVARPGTAVGSSSSSSSSSSDVLAVGSSSSGGSIVLVGASAPNSPGGFGLVRADCVDCIDSSISDSSSISSSSSGTDSGVWPGPAMGTAAISSAVRVSRAAAAAAQAAVSSIEWSVLRMVPHDALKGTTPIDAILMMPPPRTSLAQHSATRTPQAAAGSTNGLPSDSNSSSNSDSSEAVTKRNGCPLLVVPHGGPHSCMPTFFVPAYAYLCAMRGYAILHVNFRGSTGFGEAALNSLPGYIGVRDVADLLQATQAACESSSSSSIDPERIGIVGGSHGGFLACHCTAQHPEVFKCSAVRNPVTNIAAMATTSDIPDWCYVEALGCGSYDFSSFRGPTGEELSKMWSCSPLRHAAAAVAPTLVALGAKDRRVPFSQGVEWYHGLRSRGVPSKLLVYPEDVHAIDKPASEADFWVNTCLFLDEHLLNKQL